MKKIHYQGVGDKPAKKSKILKLEKNSFLISEKPARFWIKNQQNLGNL